MLKKSLAQSVKSRWTFRFLVAPLVLGLFGTLLFGFVPSAAKGTAEVGVVADAEGAATTVEQEKRKKKQRGKTVKARLVPSEPAAPAKNDKEESDPGEVKPTEEPDVGQTEAVSPTKEQEVSVEVQSAPAAASPTPAVKASSRPERVAAPATEVRESESRSATSRSTSTSEPTVTPRSTSASPRAAAVPTKPAAARAPAATPRVAADPPRPARDNSPPTRPLDVVREQVVVREVLLDVLVNDKKSGDPIAGLGPEDFTVIENGEQREVISATFYGGGEFSGTGRDGNVRSDRYFIFMFHDLKQANPGLTASQLDAGRWATRWVEDGLLPNDQVAVVGYDVRLKLYQDFTRDRQLIADAILQAARGGKDQDRWKSRSAPKFDPDSPSLFVNLPTGKTLSKATPRMQKALELIGDAAEGIAGRKNLVLFSLGFGETRGSFGTYAPDPRFYPPMEKALNNGNVAVYAINTLGALRGGNNIIGITDSLSSVARDTGGHYYSNFINVKTPLQQVSKDNKAYYLISYRTEYEVGDQGYREVEVNVKAGGAKVRARQGYRFGVSPPSSN